MTILSMSGRDGLLGHGAAVTGRSLTTGIGTALQRAATALMLWHERASQRRQLLGLSDAALKDFGAGRADAAFEGGRPFWRG
jgi:uncharacterized protein YjiS (DUF1127 family)